MKKIFSLFALTFITKITFGLASNKPLIYSWDGTYQYKMSSVYKVEDGYELTMKNIGGFSSEFLKFGSGDTFFVGGYGNSSKNIYVKFSLDECSISEEGFYCSSNKATHIYIPRYVNNFGQSLRVVSEVPVSQVKVSITNKSTEFMALEPEDVWPYELEEQRVSFRNNCVLRNEEFGWPTPSFPDDLKNYIKKKLPKK